MSRASASAGHTSRSTAGVAGWASGGGAVGAAPRARMSCCAGGTQEGGRVSEWLGCTRRWGEEMNDASGKERSADEMLGRGHAEREVAGV